MKTESIMNNSAHRFSPSVKEQIPAFIRTNTAISVLAALTSLAILVGVALFLVVTPYGWWFLPITSILVVRSLRALENLGGHEGSHWNWRRSNHDLNDRLADAFAGWWVFTSAEGFRKSHFIHHAKFGAPPDPCFTRYAMFHMAGKRNAGTIQLIRTIVKEYSPYLVDYWSYALSGKAQQVVIGATLHFALCVLLTALIPGFWIGWVVGVLLPFLFILPLLRMWAEAEEHDYDGRSEFDDTYNNLSWFSRWITHPAGDAYHLLHHTLPTVPHFRMAHVHKVLMEHDAQYKAAQKVRE
jgi:fatty acid desaturase